MIKQAHTLMDARHMIKLMQRFLTDTSYSQAEDASKDIEHLGKLAFTFINNGYVWLAFDSEEPVGILIAIKEPNLWNPKHAQLRELIWYVVPEKRNSTIGGRLFKQYCLKGDELKQQGKITAYFTSMMTSTESCDLERRGFRCTEQTYIKE
jgi:hypothetical protein